MGKLFWTNWLIFGFGLAVSGLSGAALAQDRAAPSTGAPSQVAASADVKASQYCTSIANAAADARYAWQKETLTNLEKEIEGRIQLLEKKRAEYEEWLRKRNDFLAKADETVVAIYSRMRPDAAAVQLANMQDEPAAAILAKLNPRNASAVLNEMEPARAAQLANILTDAAKRNQESDKS
ncbi:MotE family protein [Microvirga rosea]|uniref:MotE family protein n=1 Tax=Microvirga rosea TaxID=2715425 RepID=UPI001D0BA156|nr:MotE family protein [Microvirga rosea]MCB8822593.1 MotE family protein [Microvirga rosea]